MTEENFNKKILDRTIGSLIHHPSFFRHGSFTTEKVKEITWLKQGFNGDDSFRIIMDNGEEFQITVQRIFSPR